MKPFRQHLAEQKNPPPTNHGYWMSPKGVLHPVDKGAFRAKAEEISFGEGPTFLQNDGWMKMIADDFELVVTIPKFMTKQQRKVITEFVERYALSMKKIVIERRNGDVLLTSFRFNGTVQDIIDEWKRIRDTEL